MKLAWVIRNSLGLYGLADLLWWTPNAYTSNYIKDQPQKIAEFPAAIDFAVQILVVFWV